MLKHEEKIGNLDQRISIQQYEGTQNEFGEETLVWSLKIACWAKVEYAATGGGEKFAAERETAFRKVDFTIRFRDDIDEKMKVVYRGDEYDITMLNEIGRQRFLKIETVKKA